MNRLFLQIVLLLALGIFSLVAQPVHLGAEQHAKTLKDSLSLSDEQTTKVQKIYEDALTDLLVNFEKNQGGEDAILNGIKEITAETDKKIKALLNDDQKRKFNDMKKRTEESRAEGRGRGRTN